MFPEQKLGFLASSIAGNRNSLSNIQFEAPKVPETLQVADIIED